MSTLIGSFDGLHDNRVLCYCADFEAHTLHINQVLMPQASILVTVKKSVSVGVGFLASR